MRFLCGDKPIVYLHPGDVYYGDKSVLISTVLGSCLSIIMYDKKSKYGGISHCLLPNCNNKSTCGECNDSYKYVLCTMEKMRAKFESRNIKMEEVEIKAFGAADVLITTDELQKSKTIGRQNINALLSWMDNNRLKLSTHDMGGDKGRKVYFLPASGEIYLKRMINEKN